MDASGRGAVATEIKFSPEPTFNSYRTCKSFTRFNDGMCGEKRNVQTSLYADKVWQALRSNSPRLLTSHGRMTVSFITILKVLPGIANVGSLTSLTRCGGSLLSLRTPERRRRTELTSANAAGEKGRSPVPGLIPMNYGSSRIRGVSRLRSGPAPPGCNRCRQSDFRQLTGLGKC